MEAWFILLISITVSALLKYLFNLVLPTKKPSYNLPPGPLTFPIIGNFLWLRKSFGELEPILRSLHAKLGPMITLHIGSTPAIFIADRSLAHQALIQNGAVFANRPIALPTDKIVSSNQQTITSSLYGPTWRLLRRNLTAEILHPSRVKSYSPARKWVLQILKERLKSQAKSGPVHDVMENFQYAMFCLLVLMCFGDKLDESTIQKVGDVERNLVVNFNRFNILNFWPRVTKIVFRKQWEELFRIRRRQEEVLIPLIRARKELINQEKLSKAKEGDNHDEYFLAYVDTLFDLQLPKEKYKKLDESEMVSLCSEFLNAGTDTISTALQWIMANLVKYPNTQKKLLMEIKGVVGDGEEVKEDDLQNMPYLKALILEGLRRHPPGHFVLPHAVTEDVVLDGFLIPKNSVLHFMVAEMGWDPKAWDDPMAFKPERFLNDDGKVEAFDITGSRELKMMPFGVGRRICPGLGLAMLQLEYFVANLVCCFEWKAVDGDDVDLSEKQEFTVVMKNPLQVQISPRIKG